MRLICFQIGPLYLTVTGVIFQSSLTSNCIVKLCKEKTKEASLLWISDCNRTRPPINYSSLCRHILSYWNLWKLTIFSIAYTISRYYWKWVHFVQGSQSALSRSPGVDSMRLVSIWSIIWMTQESKSIQSIYCTYLLFLVPVQLFCALQHDAVSNVSCILTDAVVSAN